MHIHLKDFLLFFTGVIIPAYKLFDWLGNSFGKFFKKLFIRTEKDLEAYLRGRSKWL